MVRSPDREKTATTTTAWLSAAWLFASWMPHALHQHIGMQPAALLPVEWVFHGGAILAIPHCWPVRLRSDPPERRHPQLARRRIMNGRTG
jgi:hypothetical protein